MKIKPLHWRRVSSRPFTIASPCLHTVLIIFLLGLPPITLHSAVINGTVLNQNTQRYLERATVEVEGTSLRTLTNKDGTYRLAGVPAGTHTIIARYTELDATSRTVTVTAEETTRLDFELTSDKIYRLGEFVVTSSVEGMAFAVNQQRRAPTVRSVTSIDAFLDQATGNPGEFLKSVEGVQMDYSQNEPQSIRIRGFDPNLTMVTMDGNEIASTASSSANRAVQIDQLSIANIESVEIYKAPIPSMSANAIGGSVNFITRSAFEQKGRRASLQLGVNMDSNDFSFDKTPGPGHGDKAERRIYPAGRLRYTNSFLENRLGIDFSVGHDHTNQLGSSTGHNLNVAALSGGTLPAPPTPYDESNVFITRGTMSYAPNRQLRVRSDVSLNTDYKLTDTLALFFKSSFTNYKSTNRNHAFSLTPGSLAAAFRTGTSWSSIWPPGTRARKRSANSSHAGTARRHSPHGAFGHAVFEVGNTRTGERAERLEAHVAQVEMVEKPLATPEQERDNVELQFLEQSGCQVLLDDAGAAAKHHVLAAGRLARPRERRLDPFGHEVKRGATVHDQRLARMVSEDEDRVMERRLVTPPPFPRIRGPRSALRTKHIAAHDRRPSVLERLAQHVVVDAGLAAARIAVQRPKGFEGKHPLVEPGPALTKRVLQALIRPGDIAVERRGDLASESAHVGRDTLRRGFNRRSSPMKETSLGGRASPIRRSRHTVARRAENPQNPRRSAVSPGRFSSGSPARRVARTARAIPASRGSTPRPE